MRTLREALLPGDVFASLWLDEELVIAVGDSHDVHDVMRIEAGDVAANAAEFVERVGADADLNRYVRGAATEGAPDAGRPLREILDEVVAVALPPSLLEAADDDMYTRLLMFPDGLLAGVPLHLALSERGAGGFVEGVVYAPSAGAYVACARKALRGPPEHAAVLLGDTADDDLAAEVEDAVAALPGAVWLLRRQADLDALKQPVDLLYVASHGSADASDEDDWAVLFDGGELTAGDVYRGRLPIAPGALVVLSACDVGHVAPGPAHELEGFARALFYAGCANVVAARWPVLHEFASAVFGATLAAVARDGAAPAAALQQAVRDARADVKLKALIAAPDAEPFFWGPFVVLGCG
jgi:hypothetical protein